MGEIQKEEIRITYGNNGLKINNIEMLLLPKAKLILSTNEDNTVSMVVRDTDFDNNNVSGKLDYDTLDTFIRQLILMRKQIAQEGEL